MNRPCLSSGRAGQTRIGRRRLAGSRATRLSAARRTRATNGRCQGFYCGAEVSELLAAHPGQA
jgi:hypothetical protein